MADDAKTYTQEEFDRAVETEVKRLRAEEREATRGEHAYTEEQFSAEKQKRLDLTQRHGRRELIRRIQVRADVSHADAYGIAEPFFTRLAPREDGGVDVTLTSGGVIGAGFTSDTGWNAIDQLASEAVTAANIAARSQPQGKALQEELVAKKRRSAPFRSGLI